MPYETALNRILLVEDNSLDADLFQRALRKTATNIELEVARDGEEALSYLQKWENGAPTPIVILLDLKLPKIDGSEVLRALKSHPRYKIIPTVILSSSGVASDIAQAYATGANSYIVKAVDYDEFAKAVTLIYHYWCQLNIHPE